jgi:hypothetical protein
MPVIIGVNPVPRPKKKIKAGTTKTVKRAKSAKQTTTKGKTAMAKKRKPSVPKYKTRTKVITKVRNRRRKTAKTIRRRKTSTSEALNLGKIFRAAGAVSLGMVVAKVAVNKLTAGGSEKEAWSWPNIFMAAGSSVVAAFILGAFGLRKPTVALIAVGGVGLALFKTMTCKIATRWPITDEWFGEDNALPSEMMGADEFEVVDYTPGEMLGQTNAGGRLVPSAAWMGATEATEGGGQLVAPMPGMGSVEDMSHIANQTRMMYATGGMM